MKKLLAFLMASLMVLGSVSALATDVIVNEKGITENPEAIVAGENELIFWSLFSGGEGDYMEQIVKAYNATNPKMTVRNVMLDWGEYYTKLITGVSVGKGPDIGISHIAKLPELYDQGVVAAVDEYATTAGFDWTQVNQNTLAAATIDGEIYAVPLDTHPMVLFYNKDILAEAGILKEGEALTVPQNADEFFTFMSDLQAKMPEGKYAMSFPSNGDDPFRLFWALYNQLEGTPIISSDLTIGIEKEKAIQALDYMKKFYDAGIIPINLEDYMSHFMGGNSAIAFGGVWNTSGCENVAGLNFGVISVPKLFNVDAQWGDSHTFILPVTKENNADRRVEAMKFFDFASKNSLVWASAGHVVANVNIIASEEFANLPYRKDYADVANHVVFFEPNPYSYPIRDAIKRQIDMFLAGEQDAAATYDGIVMEIEQIIA